MRGGKREGAGRKRKEPTKIYRLPISLEAKIKELIANENSTNTTKSNNRKKLQKSKNTINPIYPIPTKEQQRRLRIWLTLHKFTKNLTQSRKITNSPKLTKKTVLKYYELAGEKHNWIINDIMNLYN